jgi:hypothetical protein
MKTIIITRQLFLGFLTIFPYMLQSIEICNNIVQWFLWSGYDYGFHTTFNSISVIGGGNQRKPPTCPDMGQS